MAMDTKFSTCITSYEQSQFLVNHIFVVQKVQNQEKLKQTEKTSPSKLLYRMLTSQAYTDTRTLKMLTNIKFNINRA